jgi:hypothetical protein
MRQKTGAKCYRDTWKCHLKHYLIGLRLRDVRPVHLQNLLNAVEQKHGTNLAHGTYKTMKVTLSAIFTEARNLGLYDDANPTTGVRIPKGRKHGRRRLAYGLDEILKHLELFSKRPIVVPKRLPRRRKFGLRRRKHTEGQLALLQEGTHTPHIETSTVRAIIGVTAFAGLRKGEIRGLWWNDDREVVLAICRSVWRSTVKNTKRRRRMSMIRGWFRLSSLSVCCSTQSSRRTRRDLSFPTVWAEHSIWIILLIG